MTNEVLDLEGAARLHPDEGAWPAQAPQSVAEVLESVSDAVLALDRHWRFTYLNSAAERLLVRRRVDLLGRNVWEEFPQAIGSTFYREYHRAIAEGVIVAFEEFYPPLATWFSVRAYPTPVGLAVYFQDVTERRQAEHALRENEERHRTISELTSDYNYTLSVSADGTTRLEQLTAGFTTITGYTLDEVNARGGWAVLVHPEDLDEARAGLARVLSGQANASLVRLITKDGSLRWVRNLNKPIIDAQLGRVTRIIGAGQDVTQRRKAEEELRENEERLHGLSRQLLAAQEGERRRLARELHDELGQTLTALSIHLKAALALGGGPAQPVLEDAVAIADQAIDQVRHIALDLRPSVLDDLGLEAALRWYADRQIRRTNLALHVDTDLGGCRLSADMETACFRVAQEALTNVARHARAARAWVELRRRDAEVELTVRDDGVGFDPSVARGRAAEGASFGLLGMQERVQLLGGQFAIESQPGRGACVRARFHLEVVLPAQEPAREGIDDEANPGVAGR